MPKKPKEPQAPQDEGAIGTPDVPEPTPVPQDRVAVTQVFNEFTGRTEQFNAAGERLNP